MKKSEIREGGRYFAKVNNMIRVVRVDFIRHTFTHSGKSKTVYDVTNLATGRKTTFWSAAKFRGSADVETERESWERKYD